MHEVSKDKDYPYTCLFLISLLAKLQLIYTASFLLHQHGSFTAKKAGVHWNIP
jgi:hypothetical protein